jgi:hypothetical protein
MPRGVAKILGENDPMTEIISSNPPHSFFQAGITNNNFVLLRFTPLAHAAQFWDD